MPNIKKLSVVYLEDDEPTRKTMPMFIQESLGDDLIPGVQLDVKTAWNMQGAIDALSMAEGSKLLLSDLQVERDFPFKLWNYAAENKTPMIIVSAYDVEKDKLGKIYEDGMRPLRKKYTNLDIQHIYKLDIMWSKEVLEAIKTKFPKLFKQESDKQSEIREGIRLR